MLSDKQNEYIVKATHRWNIKSGATGSGKTHLDFVYLIPERLRERKNTKGLNVLLGVTQQTLERNVLEPMRDHWGEELVGTIERGTSKAKLFGEVVYCLGAEKINNVSKLQGATIKYCYGDEMTKWNREVFEMLKSRLRAPNSCFDGTCNPDQPNHFVKKFIDSDNDVYNQHYTIDDNPFLPNDFVVSLKNEYKGTVYYDRYILGLWAMAEGRIYKTFTKDNIISHSDWYTRDDNGYYTHPIRKRVMYVSIGVDFGGNASATTFNATAITKNFQEMITVKEKRITKEIDPDELEEEFVSFVMDVQDEYKIIDIRADSAEQVLKRGLNKALRAKRLPYKAKDAVKGLIIDRIRFYVRMISRKRYLIIDSCPETAKAFQEAVYKADVQEDERLDDGTTNIDSLDSQEYSTEKYMKYFIDLGGRK